MGFRRTGKGRSGSIASRQLAVTLAIVMALSGGLAGCRDTLVLTDRIVGEPYLYEVDYSLEPVGSDVGKAEDVTEARNEAESDRKDQVEEDLPDLGEQDKPETTARQRHSEDSRLEKPASSGEGDGENGDASKGAIGDGEGAGLASGEGDEEGGGTVPDDGEGNGGRAAPDDEQGEEPPGDSGFTINIGEDADPPQETDRPQESQTEPDGQTDPGSTWNPGPSDKGGGEDGPGQTYNDDGLTRLPKGTSKIAAAGPYATLVQAIGGKGALAVVNQKWLDDLPPAAFDDQKELADTVGIAAWGDGTQMSEATLQAIIGSDAQTVLTSTTYGGVVTDAQAKALNEAGKNVVVMPPIGVPEAMDADIVTCVDAVGELLKDAGTDIQYDSKKMAQEWKRQHTSALERTKQKNGGYTCFLNHWWARNWLYQGDYYADDGMTTNVDSTGHRQYTVYVDGWSETTQDEVVTKIGAGESGVYLGFFREHGDWWVFPSREDDWDFDYTMARSTPIITDISDGIGLAAKRSGKVRSRYALVDYYFQHAGVMDIALGSMFTEVNYVDWNLLPGTQDSAYVALLGGRVWTWESDAVKETIYPGYSERYPAILARNRSIAESVVASAAKVDVSKRLVGLYNFGKPYGVWVVPAGVSGSWADGTFESCLFAPWAYCMFQARTADNSIDLAFSDGFVSDFYSTFYRCSASGIVDGNGNDGTSTAGGAGCGGYGKEGMYVAECPRK